MSTARANQPTADDLSLHPHNTGAYVLTPEEADDLEAACREADDDEKAGALIPIEHVLARLGAP